MGYSVYWLDDQNRFAGYAVPSICDHPDCNKEINRGFSHCCGGSPDSESGCHQYFCSEHLHSPEYSDQGGPYCERCMDQDHSFSMKPECEKWIFHILSDESWKEYRIKNQEYISELKKQVDQNNG